MKYSILAVFLFSAVITTTAQDLPWQFNGQLQMRTELDGRDFYNKTYMPLFTSMRTRLSAQKKIDEKTEFFFQAQDSRLFGEEPSTVANTKNLDVHQAYVKFQNPFGLALNLQIGRFEIAYGSERFIGTGDWHYIGRAFDGLRVAFRPAKFDLDIFAVTLAEFNSYISNATPLTYPYPQAGDATSSLYGFWLKKVINVSHALDCFSYFNLNRTKTPAGENAVQVVTLGFNHNWKYEIFNTRVEAAHQNGKQGGKIVNAFLISGSGFIKQEQMRVGGGFDFITGTPPSQTAGKNNTFNTGFGGNHRYYGYMDYFIDMPLNTKNLGLMDGYLMIDVLPRDTKVTVSVNLHQFASQIESAAGKRVFGQEVDLTMKYAFTKNATISWGSSVFFAGELMRDFFQTGTLIRDDPAFWNYCMITANF